jgi:serine/threonine-protein kinase HipA
MMLSQAWLEAKNHQIDVWTEHLPTPVLIGRLNYNVESKAGYFEWSVEAQTASLALSPFKLPLSSGVWASTSHRRLPQEYAGLPGMLNDALPDGWGLYLMDKALIRLAIKQEFISPALRLAYLGDRAWGALTFRPVMEDSPEETMTLGRLGMEVEATIEGHIEEVSNELLRAGSSPQGARPKVMVDLSDDGKAAMVTGGVAREGFSSWLIKFAARDEPADAPIIERAYMDIARAAGLHVMDSQLMDINGKPAFATRRFDRTADSRVFCHTLGGLFHYSHRAIGLDYAHLAEAMDDLSVPEASYAQAYRRAVFNAALSVRDDHAKNFAFMLNPLNEWDLAPAYDLTYTEGPGGHHAMTFAAGTSRDPTREDLLRLASHYRVDESEAARIIDEVQGVASDMGPQALGLGASKQTVSAITNRLRTISNALGTGVHRKSRLSL